MWFIVDNTPVGGIPSWLSVMLRILVFRVDAGFLDVDFFMAAGESRIPFPGVSKTRFGSFRSRATSWINVANSVKGG